ncbi:MAG: hypothetical protein KJO17_07715 [Acidimicrobiia bacterium]|nr:hypothetical protein [Acidimicrobiia bacterium]
MATDAPARPRTWSRPLSERGLFAVVAGPLLVLYLLTATWTYPLLNDAFSNSATAWSIANEGTVYLEEYRGHEETYGFISWIVPAGDSIASKYPPGAALTAVPLSLLWPGDLTTQTFTPEDYEYPWEEIYPVLEEPTTRVLVPPGPGAATAAAVTAAAMGLLAICFRRLGGSQNQAIAGGFVAGLATSAWPVAADQLWQHGPAMLWIALALVLSEGRPLGSGLAYGAAILTRPPLALIAAGAGLVRSWRERSLRGVVLVGAGSLVGLIAFLAFNGAVYGDASVSAGYGPVFQDRLFTVFNPGWYARNLFDALFSRQVGVLLLSPFLLVLLPGLVAGWRAAPAWARGAALGGIAYLLVQFKANRATGGDFLGYRYPLEAMVAAAPVLFLSYRESVAKRPPLRRPFLLAVAVSVVVQGLASVGIGFL